MAFGDEKVVVDVKEIDHGEILYIDTAGAETRITRATATGLRSNRWRF